MDTLEMIRSRRSIRSFKPDLVESGLITQILEAGRLAPSSTNTQPWKFVVVRSDDARLALCEAAYGQSMVRQAPVVIVALGDRERFKNWLQKSQELIAVGAIDLEVVETIGEFYTGHDPDRKIAINCAVALGQMALAAASLGLGSCCVMLMKPDEVARVLRAPDSVFPVAMLPLGYADECPTARPRYTLEEVAFDEDIEHTWNADA